MLFNRQRAVEFPMELLREISREAAVRCLPHPGKSPSVLASLPEVEISLVSDRVIARIHRQFLSVPGATDVITFPHGEIVVSAATAVRLARQNEESTEREIARYIVHGFLHLHGHEDANGADAAMMWQAQEQVLEDLWPVTRQRRSSSR